MDKALASAHRGMLTQTRRLQAVAERTARPASGRESARQAAGAESTRSEKPEREHGATRAARASMDRVSLSSAATSGLTASRSAGADSPEAPNPERDTVEQIEARNHFNTNIKVGKTSQEMFADLFRRE